MANPLALMELLRERPGHAIEEPHRPHLLAALDWLEAAQDATADDGISRGYGVTFNRYFRKRGWQPSYPETTGYIIPTLLEAAVQAMEGRYAHRALRAARWECDIQMESGAVQGGVIGQGRTPAVFNTGQVMLGWLAAFEQSGDERFAECTRRAGSFLLATLGPDGHWNIGNSQFANAGSTLYNARVAWALAEAGVRLEEHGFRDAATRNLRAVVAAQTANGWFPDCCLSDARQPLLHTIAYTIRGLLEGGRVLEDPAMLAAAVRPARVLLEQVRPDGFMPGRFKPDWSGAVPWSCLTGQAQMANNWIRLHLITGDKAWLDPVPQVLSFLKRTQNRVTSDRGLRGGIKGSYPLNGEYGAFEVLNWATKYFADALMRHQQVLDGTARARAAAFTLA